MKQDVISLTQKQLNTLDVINKAIAGFITVAEAASALGLSERQVQRLKKKVRESGPAAIVHKNSLRVPHNAIPEEVKNRIISLKKSGVYESANFCHFRELLLQTDTAPFPWFKGDRKQYSIHGAIDDATSQITALYMCKNECLHGYFEMLRQTISNYGIPLSMYADRHTIFQSPNKEKAVIDSSLAVNDTQFGRCLKELDIELIPARSPQAKGRIERLWETLQSRLPVEFALRGISTIDEANEFLASYIYAFNSEFAVEPSHADSMFHKPSEGMNIGYVLCVKEERTVDAGGVFSFHNWSFTPNSGLVRIWHLAWGGIIPE